MAVPNRAIITHVSNVKFQPSLSESNATTYVDRALPIYVQELRTPDAVDTIPYF